LDQKSRKLRLNFTLLATPAEGLAGRFIRIDREQFGVIEGVTDREYYTNSFHIPVYYDISCWKKIQLEAPYHALTNAGHITYVELDGDASQNLDAFEKVVHAMRKAGVGYGAINHPINSDPVCGFYGVINDEVCPKCGRKENPDAPFERVRRITGYLVGTLERFNDAKRAEVRDRVRHSVDNSNYGNYGSLESLDD
jgi:anaerobic ribonucleoside-triphosphate reductase